MHYGFVGFLLLTLITLGLAIAAGLRRRRRLHLALVAATVLLLAGAVWQALVMGQHYDLRATGLIFTAHRVVSRLTVAALLAPVGSGLLLLRSASYRPLHRKIAWVTLAAIAVTSVLGTAMVLLAPAL